MRPIKKLLTKIDLFGVTYNFKYKSKEKYQTSLGGFFILIFVILVCFMGIYYFIPFINRKNYTIVYYAMNLAVTEEINLFYSESNFAVGLSCESNKNEYRVITDLLNLEGKYVTYVKNRDGTFKKNSKKLDMHQCTYDDFYNKYDKQMDYLGVQNFECVENKDDSIQGIFSDQIFSYFEFSAIAKNNSKNLTEEIIRFLFENDCKLQFVYTDIIIDLDDYKSPETQYLNVIFTQLNPTLFIKRNIYFMNQYFSNDDYLLFVFGDEDPSEVKPLYSRYEEYALYKGMKRFDDHPDEFEYYTKIYIRADLKKTVIKRKYQKFMEFYADASSLLIAIYGILDFIFNYINTFYANHSLSKSIFFFKDLEENGFNIFKKKQKIQELLYITELSQGKNNSNKFDSKNNKQSEGFNYFENNKQNHQIEIFKRNRDNRILGNTKDSTSRNLLDYGRSHKVAIYNKKKNQLDFFNIKNYNDIGIKKEIEQLRTNKIVKPKNNNNYFSKNRRIQYSTNEREEAMIYFRNNAKKDESSDSQGTKMEDISSESSEPKKKIIRVYNSFNIFEIIITEFLKCCRSQEMIIKSEVNEKANNIIFKKVDIITYVRNMILFDIMNQIILDEGKKTIINFLGRPVISLNTKQKNVDEFYKNYREKDFKKFAQEIQDLSQKQNKTYDENKLISVSNEHLQVFV